MGLINFSCVDSFSPCPQRAEKEIFERLVPGHYWAFSSPLLQARLHLLHSWCEQHAIALPVVIPTHSSFVLLLLRTRTEHRDANVSSGLCFTCCTAPETLETRMCDVSPEALADALALAHRRPSLAPQNTTRGS